MMLSANPHSAQGDVSRDVSWELEGGCSPKFVEIVSALIFIQWLEKNASY